MLARRRWSTPVSSSCCPRVLDVCLLALVLLASSGAALGAHCAFAPVEAPSVLARQQAALARQETAPTARPWAAVLLSAGTPSVLAAVHPSAHRAAAPTQAIVLRSAHTHVRAEDIVDVGSQGSDPNPRAAPAPAAAWSAATEGRVDDSSHGTDPSPRPAPGSAAAAEAAHDATDEVIVGADDRMRVMATTSYPWRAIGSLVGTTAKDGIECTAALIAPAFLLTAAHCVYAPNSGYLGNLRFVAGRDDLQFPFGTAKGVRASVPDAYRSMADADTSNSNYGSRRPYDWAVVKLDAAIGSRLGYFGRFRDFNSSDFIMNTAGYPFDKGNQMWFSECAHQRMSPTEGSAFPYFCSTQPGNSGGPVWVNQDGKRLYVGIHTGSDGLQTNYGTRYSSEVHAFVVNAMATL